MRGLKSTILLVVVLGGLVGYIYFVESKKPASGTDDQGQGVRGADGGSDRGDADQERKRRDVARAEDAATTWKLVEPEAVDADSVRCRR